MNYLGAGTYAAVGGSASVSAPKAFIPVAPLSRGAPSVCHVVEDPRASRGREEHDAPMIAAHILD